MTMNIRLFWSVDLSLACDILWLWFASWQHFQWPWDCSGFGHGPMKHELPSRNQPWPYKCLQMAVCMEVSINGGTPISGWFLLGKTPENSIVRNGWWLGVPLWPWKSPNGGSARCQRGRPFARMHGRRGARKWRRYDILRHRYGQYKMFLYDFNDYIYIYTYVYVYIQMIFMLV